MNRPTGLLFLLGVLLWSAGCSRPPPFQRRIEAETSNKYLLWFGKQARDLSPEQERLYVKTTTELKLQLMLQDRAHGAQPVDDALCADLHGQIFGDVLVKGLKARNKRLAGELEEALLAYRTNAGHAARIRGEEKIEAFNEHQKRLEEKVSRLTEEVKESRDDLALAQSWVQ